MQKNEFNYIFKKILGYTVHEDGRVREIAMSDALAVYCSNVFNLPAIDYSIFTQFLMDPVIENVMLATDCLKQVTPLFTEQQIGQIIAYLQKTLEAEEDAESTVCYSMLKAMISLISSDKYSIPGNSID